MISSRKIFQPPWIAVGHDEGVGEERDVLALRAVYGNTYEPVSMLGDWTESSSIDRPQPKRSFGLGVTLSSGRGGSLKTWELENEVPAYA